MIIEINGNQYDIIRGLEEASLQTLYTLKVRQGIGMKTLMESARKLELTSDPMDILEDPEAFMVLMTVIWLARRAAGEKISFEDANDDFGIASLKFVNEDEPEPEAADPKAPAASDPADAPAEVL